MEEDVVLMAQVTATATHLRQTCRRLARVAKMGFDLMDSADFKCASETAVWLAYYDLNAIKSPVDWVAQRDDLLSRARALLSREVQGAQTAYGDYRARSSISPRSKRKAGRFGALRRVPSPGQWQAWSQVEPTSSNQAKALAAPDDYQPQEIEMRRNLLSGLRTALMQVLTQAEMFLMEEHYLKGRKQRDIAKELASQSPAYAARFEGDEAGWRRCEKRVEKAISRARTRAALRLPPEWAQLLEPA